MLAIMAVRAAIRIGRTAADAFRQYAQERPILIPDADKIGPNAVAYILIVRDQAPEFANALQQEADLATLWNNASPTAEAADILAEIAFRYDRLDRGEDQNLGIDPDDEVAGGMMVAQWAQGKGPVSPWARVLVGLADVGLEFVGAQPQILGVGSEGEKLIGAIATSIGETLPDATTRAALGPKDRFGERLGALAFRSGLSALTRNPDLVFAEEHLKALLDNALPPIIDALPEDDITRQVEWRNVADAFLGPSISAALTAVAGRQSAFLGDAFASEKAAGVMVSGLLKAAAALDAEDRFSRQGLTSLMQAAIKTAAENPELILGEILDADLSIEEERSKAESIALNMFKEITDELASREPPYNDELGLAVAIAAIEGLQISGPVLVDEDNPWEKVAGGVVSQVLDGLQLALGDEGQGIGDTVFSREKLVDLARIFVSQAAETPHMIAGGREDLKGLANAVASAMAADRDLLLTSNDWSMIAAVAAQEAALNPGRLFGFGVEAPKGKIAADVLSKLLSAASADLAVAGRGVGPVLVGETLREVMIVTLRGLGGNLTAAIERQDDIKRLAEAISAAASREGKTFGGKEALRIFRAVLPGVLASGDVPVFDDARILELLS